jgi:hypothetical protein
VKAAPRVSEGWLFLPAGFVIVTIAYRDLTCGLGMQSKDFCLCPCIRLVDSFSTGFSECLVNLNTRVCVSDVQGWSYFEILRRVPVDNWHGYQQMLQTNPVFAKMCISGVVYTLGDWSAQVSFTYKNFSPKEVKKRGLRW